MFHRQDAETRRTPRSEERLFALRADRTHALTQAAFDVRVPDIIPRRPLRPWRLDLWSTPGSQARECRVDGRSIATREPSERCRVEIANGVGIGPHRELRALRTAREKLYARAEHTVDTSSLRLPQVVAAIARVA